jgi:hypothetical protein
MFQNRLQFGPFRKRISAWALSAALVLFGGIMMTAAPVVRSTELNEHSSRERAEDPTIAHRVELERYLRFANGPDAFLRPAQLALGHSQRPILEPPAGHRLANGLLAPITC